MILALCVALGAALGSPLRFACERYFVRVAGESFPWGTLLVNVVGSALFGAVVGAARGGGLSIALLLNYAHDPFLALFPIGATIASKYVFTFEDNHVINPSLFGVVTTLLFMGDVVGRLFRESTDAIEVIKLRDLYQQLEEAVDAAQDSGKVISRILAKHH